MQLPPIKSFENVDVSEDGTVAFESDRNTKNTRAVISRDNLQSASDDIDLYTVDQVYVITRSALMPPVDRFDYDEVAVAFMLGESVETSAGDRSAVGDSIRVVGTNPFIIGLEGTEGNRFRDLISNLDIDCYILNTGRVRDTQIVVEDAIEILWLILYGDLNWNRHESTGLMIPLAPTCTAGAVFRSAVKSADYDA